MALPCRLGRWDSLQELDPGNHPGGAPLVLPHRYIGGHHSTVLAGHVRILVCVVDATALTLDKGGGRGGRGRGGA